MGSGRTLGFWIIAVVSILWLIFMLLGQVMAPIDYDFTVALGLQEAGDVITPMGVAVNKGFGVGDTLVYIPLIVIGLAGLWRRRAWGLVAMAGAFGITAYFPSVCLSMLLFGRKVPGFAFTRFTAYTIFLTSVMLSGVWGLWYLWSRGEALVRKDDGR